MTALVATMKIVTGFIAANAELLNENTIYSVKISPGYDEHTAEFHVVGNPSATKAVTFGLAELDGPTAELTRSAPNSPSNVTQVFLRGTYAGIRIELAALASDEERERLHALDGWVNNKMALSLEALRELAATDPS